MTESNATTPVTHHVLAAFAHARTSQPELHKNWNNISFRIGSLLPNSLLMMSLQRAGDLDMLLRAMEDDGSLASAESDTEYIAPHYQLMLSELWIGHIYEIVRLLDARRLAHGDGFVSLAHDLRLLRIPLEKHEIVADSKLTSPLSMRSFPSEHDDEQKPLFTRRTIRSAHI